jgi:hypothetical protein
MTGSVDEGDTMPDTGIGSELGSSGSRDTRDVAVDVAEHDSVGRLNKESTRGSAGIDSGVVGVLTVDTKTRDVTTDISGANFKEFVAGLGVGNASSQSQEAYIEAEKYFVSFHKILIIN